MQRKAGVSSLRQRDAPLSLLTVVSICQATSYQPPIHWALAVHDLDLVYSSMRLHATAHCSTLALKHSPVSELLAPNGLARFELSWWLYSLKTPDMPVLGDPARLKAEVEG